MSIRLLTKRSERLAELHRTLPWAPHLWMGVSVENSRFTFRIEHLRETDALVKFLSLEPLLGPLPDLDLRGINWVIVGGESGPGARPMERSWILDIRDQCTAAGVAFFFKQWGGVFKSRTGRELDGRTWNEMPARADGGRAARTAIDPHAVHPDARRPVQAARKRPRISTPKNPPRERRSP